MNRRGQKNWRDFVQWSATAMRHLSTQWLGFVWSKQEEICNSVVENRFTAVKSCHSVGKTAIAARISAWWLSVHPPGDAFLVTSAPTGAQVKALLWREINAIHKLGGLPGRTNTTEWLFGNELVGFGRSVRDADPRSFPQSFDNQETFPAQINLTKEGL